MTATPTSAPEPLDVVVVGEALIDIVESPTGQIEYPGGSPANVAYGLGRLDVKAGLLTAIGRDQRGDAIAAHLQGAGVVLLPGSKSLGKTATATARIAADGSAEYTFEIEWHLPRSRCHMPQKSCTQAQSPRSLNLGPALSGASWSKRRAAA